MKHFILSTAIALPLSVSAAFAAGGGNETAPPKPKCEAGMVYDKETKSCVNAQESNLDVDSLYENLRELAYAGRYKDAEAVMAQMPVDDDRRLTYMGFTQRKQGNVDAAMGYYAQALALNPANNLARSYMAQGFVEQGKMTQALAELREIRAQGGSGTWAEASLRTAIATGQTFSY
ncbi:TPR repeat domain protein [Sulfitobacter noctilucae]|uniref:tetratricopeptide repeat protein n=1 Tax=Sulfitobacter noctilucae TaxID=1342302 RepID=UPI0004680CF6|nr:tetratricopeptide repeat protein [Sulfitobacter noctilucae]KIN60618.1 TPR repeat domain protein [Sulfitobacter noctilucae]